MGGSPGGGSPSSQTVTQVSEPPDYVVPSAENFLARAQGLSNLPFQTYEGERISPLNEAHQAGIQSALFTPELTSARNLAHSTLEGDFLNSNPYLDATFNRAADQVQSRMTNATAGNNLTNSGVQEAYGRQLNDLATNIYGQNYQQERARQQSIIPIASQLPGIQSQLQLGAGDIGRDFDQSRINEAIRSFEEQRLFPYSQADVLGRAIGISMGSGGSVSTTSPGFFQPSRTAGMLGGGLAGLGLAQQAFGNNTGANLAGGGLGALLGGLR